MKTGFGITKDTNKQHRPRYEELEKPNCLFCMKIIPRDIGTTATSKLKRKWCKQETKKTTKNAHVGCHGYKG